MEESKQLISSLKKINFFFSRPLYAMADTEELQVKLLQKEGA